MTSIALVTVLRAAGRAGVAVCLWGDPGIGKSPLIRAAAAADDVPCETVIGSLREPSDFAGLPVVTDGGVRLEPPAWAKRLHAAQDAAPRWSRGPAVAAAAPPRTTLRADESSPWPGSPMNTVGAARSTS